MAKSYDRKWCHKGGIIRQRGAAYQVEINVGGTRHRETFPTLVQAKQVIDQKLIDLRNEGIAALSLNTAQRTDAAKALIHLPDDTTLDDAVQHYVKAVTDLAGASLDAAVNFYNRHHKPTGGVKTVATLLGEYEEAKRKSMRRERTIMDITSRVGLFSKHFGERHVHTITPHEIDQWLDESKYGSQTRINYLRVLSGFFNFARRQHLIEANPADREHIERPQTDEHLPETFPFPSVEKLLTTALTIAPSLVPYLSIGFFAGLRTAELGGLNWSSVDLDQKLITVRPETAKRRRQRHVDIHDNLAAWLRPAFCKEGPVCPGNMRRLLGLVTRSAKVKWVHNGMRHTYASNHLTHFQDIGKTMLQLGHVGGAGILFNHYRNLVKPADADAYWKIMPPVQQEGPVLSSDEPT